MSDKVVKCPWCNAHFVDSHEDLDQDADMPEDLLRYNPMIVFCQSCEQFYKVEIETKTIKMKLVEENE